VSWCGASLQLCCVCCTGLSVRSAGIFQARPGRCTSWRGDVIPIRSPRNISRKLRTAMRREVAQAAPWVPHHTVCTVTVHHGGRVQGWPWPWAMPADSQDVNHAVPTCSKGVLRVQLQAVCLMAHRLPAGTAAQAYATNAFVSCHCRSAARLASVCAASSLRSCSAERRGCGSSLRLSQP
jgi:hypothetical protein